MWRAANLWGLPPDDRGREALFLVADAISQEVADLADERPVHLCLEGLFVAPLRKKQRHESFAQYDRRVRRVLAQQQAAIPLAESAGELRGGLGMVPRWRPKASEWRELVLGRGWGRAKADAAEAEAVRQAPLRWAWPDCAPPPSKAERGAVAEAACMAHYGHAMLKQGDR